MIAFHDWLGRNSNILPGITSRLNNTGRQLCLTFDDGPHPDITPRILDLLAYYKAKATFFVLGSRAAKHPELIHRIKSDGHVLGNHTFNHLNGWKTPTDAYLDDIAKTHAIVSSVLFRPPYGKMRPSQYMQLRKQYKIIMWSCLTADYDRNITPQKCLKNALAGSYDGSILVFHDSEKASKNLDFALPRLLETLALKKFGFIPIKHEDNQL